MNASHTFVLAVAMALSALVPAAAEESVVAQVVRRDLTRMLSENETMLERLGATVGKAPVERARAMVAAMRELGMTHEYFEKPGGTHAMLEPSRPRIFEFFNRHKRSAAR